MGPNGKIFELVGINGWGIDDMDNHTSYLGTDFLKNAKASDWISRS